MFGEEIIVQLLSDSWGARRDKFSRMGDELLVLYALVHGLFPSHPMLLARLLSMTDEIPLEKYLDRLFEHPDGTSSSLPTAHGADEVLSLLGIVVPPGYRTLNYVVNNIRYYDDVAAAPPSEVDDRAILEHVPGQDLEVYFLVNRYPDRDILSLIGVYFHYRNRRELVAKISDYLMGSDLFLWPLTAKPTNPTTYLGTEVSSTTVIGYGHYKSFRAYEEEEFIMNCKLDKRFSCSLPGDNGVLTRKQIKELYRLLEAVGIWPQLSKLLRQGLSMRLPTISTIRKSLASLPEPSKIERFLTEVFTTGMAMRGWTSGPYPHREADTLSSPEPLTSQQLTKLGVMLEEMSSSEKELVSDFSLYNGTKYLRDSLVDRLTLIKDHPEDVTACIRVNSGYLVLTSAEYLHQLFGVTVPGFIRDDFEWIA
jgi:hypothetical protein